MDQIKRLGEELGEMRTELEKCNEEMENLQKNLNG